jgi:hypothetical protein
MAHKSDAIYAKNHSLCSLCWDNNFVLKMSFSGNICVNLWSYSSFFFHNEVIYVDY